MRDPLRHYQHYQEGSPYAGGSSFMERVAERVASGLGTVQFVVISTLIIGLWIAANGALLIGVSRFDKYPFILLNLAFSAQAFYTGALVIIAQKAQTRTDRANEEASAKHREELTQMQQQVLDAIHELVKDDTPGGTGAVMARLAEVERKHDALTGAMAERDRA